MPKSYLENPGCPKCGNDRLFDLEESSDYPAEDGGIPYITRYQFFTCRKCGCRYRNEIVYRRESAEITVLKEARQ